MRAHHSLQNNMGAHAQSADHSFCSMPQCTSDVERDVAGLEEKSWHRAINSSDETSHEGHGCMQPNRRASYASGTRMGQDGAPSTSTSAPRRDIPEALAAIIMDMVKGQEGQELGQAFRTASDIPPITKQSLSELDIQTVIVNMKLRHDINFDRDLSFRPNLDGFKGQEKQRVMSTYYRALVAELDLYVRLFQGAQPLWSAEHMAWPDVIHHAQRRIPKMFETIKEVLKSLVPERDHIRVDEHLDVPMLMQEIERGVCDLVRLAEWMAHLLKEHCAPMRDWWVDKMVARIKSGVVYNKPDDIVEGLAELLGILEAMKLDVANHQIRNLKSLLIEDTVNFERHYHLERLVEGRSRVKADAAQKWYAAVLKEFRQQCSPPQKDTTRFQLDVFTRAIVSTLFSTWGRCDFPETFYLDLDRLRGIKSEIDDLVFFDICLTFFAQQLGQLGCNGPISPVIKQQLRSSLMAIIGDDMGPGQRAWAVNSEPISLEIMRQAFALAGLPPTFDFGDLQKANQNLREALSNSFSDHASTLENAILPHILASIARYINASPMELFNNLVAHPTAPSSPFSHHSTDTLSLSSYPEQLVHLSNRITHVILLHWRVWGPIAYMQDETESSTLPEGTPASPPHTISPPPVGTKSQILTRKTGEPLDSGQETQVTHET